MNCKKPFFSIIMPTYNSAITLPQTLASLQQQTLFPSEVELLIIDGGSSDATVDIAKNAGARIISNPERLPEAAKLIGINEANGKFIIKMDSDELLTSKTQLEDRKKALEAYSDSYVLLPHKMLPVGKNGFYSAYSTLLGDPFSFFIYRNRGDFIKTYRKHITTEKSDIVSFRFAENDLLPIADSGTTTISLEYIRYHLSSKMHDPSFAATMAEDVIRRTNKMICIKEDKVMHNNPMSRESYLRKLQFRIINNIFDIEKSGFSSRAKDSTTLRAKKYLYFPYCLLFVPVLLDAIILCISYRRIRYIEHIFLSFYVLFLIMWNMSIKVLGITKTNTCYGE